MFDTIKSKIVAITVSLLVALTAVFIVFVIYFYDRVEDLLFFQYKYKVERFSTKLDNDISKLENNAKDLALIGKLYYNAGRDKNVAEYAVLNIFDNYKDSLGGGIWFKPYVADRAKKLFCVYAFRKADNNVIIDNSFESEKYDYPNQSWYKEIMPKLKKEHTVAWSLPYLEKQGSNANMITVGSGIYDENGNLIGLSTVDWKIDDIEKEIKKIGDPNSRKDNEVIPDAPPGTFALFADLVNDSILVSTDKNIDNESLRGKSLKNISWYRDDLIDISYIQYQGKTYIPYVKYINDKKMVLIMNVPRDELFYKNELVNIFTILPIVILLISVILSVLLYFGLHKYIHRPIRKLMDIANRIGHGEQNIEIKVEKPLEFVKLAQTFDAMTKDIKSITKEREKINSELSIAKSIQASSLPDVFPPFPERKEFDIFASMEPAKEVGGDFYDFYFIDDDHFMFLIADVSGKGVPAALFMMTTKTLINNISMVGYEPQKLIETINDKICSSNKQGFFVTVFASILNVKTGKMTCINCGHNLPLIKRANGAFEYLKLDSNVALGVFPEYKFNIYETQLNPGDMIFTYTDGITEAMNSEGELFGETKLIDSLNTIDETDTRTISEKIKSNVKTFTGGITQSDDITMLVLRYNGENLQANQNLCQKMNFKSPATNENYKPFYTWLHQCCQDWNLDETLTNKADMCAEELYANICFYAYPNQDGGMIEVMLNKTNNQFIMEFQDEGIPYNPFEKSDPDINLPPEERQLGGLGIFMVKEMTDEIAYKYSDNKNILTLKFNL